MVAVALKAIAVMLMGIYLYNQHRRLESALERIRNLEARVFENE